MNLLNKVWALGPIEGVVLLPFEAPKKLASSGISDPKEVGFPTPTLDRGIKKRQNAQTSNFIELAPLNWDTHL